MRAERARVIAWALFLTAMALVLAGLVFLVLSLDQPTDTFGFRGAAARLTVAVGALGLVIARARPENPIGWILLVSDLFWGVQAFGQEYAVYALLERRGEVPGGAVAGWVDTWAWAVPIGALTMYLLLLFPTGRLPSRRWRVAMVVGTVGIVAMSIATALEPGPIQSTETVANPFAVDMTAEEYGPFLGIAGLPFLAGIVAAVSSLVVRFRRADVEERQQTKWLAVGGVLTAASLGALAISEALSPAPGAGAVEVLVVLSGATIPAATAVAILKYRLYDIDVVINRAVVFGLLAGFITAIYVAIVVGVGALVGDRGGLVLPGVAAAVVALAFQPARQRARHVANRLVYGNRATPYEVLSEFADRMATTYSLDDVLPRLTRLVAEGTGARRVGVWVRVGGQLHLEAIWPSDADWPTLLPGDTGEVRDATRTVPVMHHGERLGLMAVEMPPQEVLAPAHEKLLDDVAAQAALVLRNVALVEDLRASRQRIVAAQDEERRRIERNIHDGAQQQLVALSVKARLVESFASKDPKKAATLAGEVRTELQDALENLRDLARGIYPPLLADGGLVAAVQAQARKSAIPVHVSVDGVARYAPEIEAAVYFCVLEALQNAAKYSGAGAIDVRIGARDGVLLFSVRDDGRGFDVAATPRGSGLQNLEDRVAALGGTLSVRSEPGAGTTVEGRVPAQPAEAAAQASSSRPGSNSDLGM